MRWSGSGKPLPLAKPGAKPSPEHIGRRRAAEARALTNYTQGVFIGKCDLISPAPALNLWHRGMSVRMKLGQIIHLDKHRVPLDTPTASVFI